MSYYTTKKVMEIIKLYHININNLNTLSNDAKSVGISQYGIESSLPKSEGGFSSVVENEVLRQLENTKFYTEMITDMKYLQDRLYRITNEKEAIVLQLTLSGYGTSDIAEITSMHRSGVYEMLKRIAGKIRGYPQTNATDSTNFIKETV